MAHVPVIDMFEISSPSLRGLASWGATVTAAIIADGGFLVMSPWARVRRKTTRLKPGKHCKPGKPSLLQTRVPTASAGTYEMMT